MVAASGQEMVMDAVELEDGKAFQQLGVEEAQWWMVEGRSEVEKMQEMAFRLPLQARSTSGRRCPSGEESLAASVG